ncbi:MAG: T9SS type A sorting domain-containing protein [Flavobacteriales bacterium]
MKLPFSTALIILFTAATTFAQDNRIWATYYGGTGWENFPRVCNDKFGNVYLGGSSPSLTGIASGGFQNTYGGGPNDGFLVKFDAAGNRIWATYYGGADDDYITSVETDTIGNVFVAGYTLSTTGIASSGFQNAIGGTYDAFIVKFDANGNRIWGTYYGGTASEFFPHVSLDKWGNIYLSGPTQSFNGIASGGFQNFHNGGSCDAYLVKFDPNGNRIWGTYYGGTSFDDCRAPATIDNAGNIYLTGYSGSLSGIALNGHQNSMGGSYDAFLVKFNSAGNRMWATYYGDTAYDYGYSSIVDDSGNIYLSGLTENSSGIAFNGYQNTIGGMQDAFVVKFDSTGNRIWGTYFGGAYGEEFSGHNLVKDNTGHFYLGGNTYSSNNIALGGYQNNLITTENQYLVKFTMNGIPVCATYYGQSHEEECSISVDNYGNVYLAGTSQSASGIASGGFQNSLAGSTFDAYLVRFTNCSNDDIAELFPPNNFSFYPNPLTQTSVLEFENPGHENYTLSIFNSLGKEVQIIKNITINKTVIERKNLPTGLYFFQLGFGATISASGKFVVE